jgi:hypothetical protein
MWSAAARSASEDAAIDSLLADIMRTEEPLVRAPGVVGRRATGCGRRAHDGGASAEKESASGSRMTAQMNATDLGILSILNVTALSTGILESHEPGLLHPLWSLRCRNTHAREHSHGCRSGAARRALADAPLKRARRVKGPGAHNEPGVTGAPPRCPGATHPLPRGRPGPGESRRPAQTPRI